MHGVGADQHHDWRALAASAMAWWAEAGVDVLVDDTPRDWRAKPVQPPAPVARAPALPDTLDAFIAWRLGPDAPEAGAHGPRVLIEGPPTAPLLAMVDCPDGDTILRDATSRLFDRMLAAIGLRREEVGVATFATARPLTGRIDPQQEAALAPLARHLLELARPQRLLIMGAAASRALLGADGARRRGSLQRVNLDTITIDAVAILSPGALIDQPRSKAEAWRGLQALMGDKP